MRPDFRVIVEVSAVPYLLGARVSELVDVVTLLLAVALVDPVDNIQVAVNDVHPVVVVVAVQALQRAGAHHEHRERHPAFRDRNAAADVYGIRPEDISINP